jgi:hypothetical protein
MLAPVFLGFLGVPYNVHVLRVCIIYIFVKVWSLHFAEALYKRSERDGDLMRHTSKRVFAFVTIREGGMSHEPARVWPKPQKA